MRIRKMLEITLVVSTFAFALYAESVALGDYFAPATGITTSTTSHSETWQSLGLPFCPPPYPGDWVAAGMVPGVPIASCPIIWVHVGPPLPPQRHNGIQFN